MRFDDLHGAVLLVKLTSASQEIPCNLLNLEVRYLIHKSPKPVLVLSQIKPLHHEELQSGFKRSLSESD